MRSAYREAADILKENATSERRLYLAERDSRWLSMDEGWDRIVEAQVRLRTPHRNNNRAVWQIVTDCTKRQASRKREGESIKTAAIVTKGAIVTRGLKFHC